MKKVETSQYQLWRSSESANISNSKEIISFLAFIKHKNQTNWFFTKVGEVAKSIKPGFASGKHNKLGNGIPHLRPMNINTKGEIDLSTVKYVMPKQNIFLKKGDVLFNNTNSPELVGKTAFINQDNRLAYSNHMTRIEVNKRLIEPKWLSIWLHYLFFRGYFKFYCTKHVNQASINTKFLSNNVFVPLPPLNEQKRIVAKIEELFSKLDAGVESLKKAEAQLRRYRQSVLKAAFEGKLTEKWREKHKERESSIRKQMNFSKKEKVSNQEYAPSRLKKIPISWTWATIGDIKESMKNGIYKPKKFYSDDGIPCLRMYNIEDGKIVWKNIKRMVLSEQELKDYGLLAGDILINRVNSRELVGKSAVIPDGLGHCVYESKNIRLRVKKKVSLSKYVNYWLLLEARNFFNRNAQQTVGMASINQEQISLMPIPLTSLKEQQKIIEEIERRFSIIDSLEKTIDNSLKEAERLRQAILKKAFEGRLVPQDPNDEPAWKLLERIKEEKKRLEAEKKNKKKRTKKG